jgi:hypothetical protein
MTTPAQVRAAREYLGFDQLTLAEALGIAERTLRRWEAAAAPIPDGVADELWKLVAHHQATVDRYVREARDTGRMLVDDPVNGDTGARVERHAAAQAWAREPDAVIDYRTEQEDNVPNPTRIDGDNDAGVIELAEAAQENLRELNHRTQYAAMPAPLIYRYLAELKQIPHRMPQLLEQLGGGLTRSLDEYDVYDHKRDPKASVDEALKHLATARAAMTAAGVALEAAQSAINDQGYHE